MIYKIAHGNAVHYGYIYGRQVFESGQPNVETFTDFEEWIDRLNQLGVDTSEIEEPERNVPQTISPLQGKIMLDELGLLDDVEAFIEQAPKRVQLAYENATQWRRFSPMILEFSSQFGIDLDTFFETAKTIEV